MSDHPMPSVGHVRLTDDEITVACQEIGLPRPPTLPGVAAEHDPTPAASATLGESPAWIRDLLMTLAKPQTVVFAHCQENGSPVSIAVFAVSAPWAVEQRPQPGTAYELSLFGADEVLQRVGAYCGLSARSVPNAGCCEISGSTWLELLERATTDLPAALRLLRAEGVAAAERDTLGPALASWERMAQVTVAQRPTATRLEGSSTSWLDGGPAGLWQIDAPKLATSGDYGDYGDALLQRTQMTLCPVSDETLLADIAHGFAPNAA